MQLKIHKKTIIAKGDFNSSEKVWNELLTFANNAGFTVLATAKHHFYPYGFSGVIIIGESHIAIHTFPENNQAWIELATCVDNGQIDAFIKQIKNNYTLQ